MSRILGLRTELYASGLWPESAAFANNGDRTRPIVRRRQVLDAALEANVVLESRLSSGRATASRKLIDADFGKSNFRVWIPERPRGVRVQEVIEDGMLLRRREAPRRIRRGLVDTCATVMSTVPIS